MRPIRARTRGALFGICALLMILPTRSLGGWPILIEDYKYLSLASYPDAKIVRWMEKAPPMVYFADAVPLEYEIVRQHYVLRLRLPDEANGRSFRIAIVEKSDRSYTIQGPDIIAYDGPNRRYPGYEFFFAPPPDIPKKTLRFSVFDETGKLIAHENIPFEVRKSGKVLEIDGL